MANFTEIDLKSIGKILSEIETNAVGKKSLKIIYKEGNQEKERSYGHVPKRDVIERFLIDLCHTRPRLISFCFE